MAAAQQAMLEQALVTTTLAAARDAEAKLDAEIKTLSSLDSNDLQRIRAQRVAALKRRQADLLKWRAQGHGVYDEVGDQTEWFNTIKTSKHTVCHFYRGTTWRCEIVDKHLTRLAAKHPEAKFFKINAEKSPFLCERLNVVLLPTIVLTEDAHMVHMIEGFDELGGTDQFTTAQLEKCLCLHKVLEGNPYEDASLAKQKAPQSKATYATGSNQSGAAIYQSNAQGGSSVAASRNFDDIEFSDEEDAEFWK